MDSYEASNMVFTKIKFLDPENASKIMGFLLIQDLGEKDLIRLAFGPEAYIHALILKARTHLGLSSNASSTPSSPSPLNPIARPTSTNNNPFSHSSPRLPNGFDFPKNPSSPSSNCWPLSGFSNNSISPKSSPLLSYDNIRAGSLSLPPPRNGFESNTGATNNADLIDEYQLNEYLSFLNDPSSSSSRAEDFLELGHGGQNWAHSGNNGDTHFHRRSYSASDVCFGSEEPGLGSGYKPCLYFARGFCKNGSNCKFVHGGFSDSMDGGPGPIVGSPTKFDEFELHEEIMRLKAAQHQRQFMPGLSVSPSPSPSSSSSSYNKYIAFLLQQQQQNDPQRAATAAAFMMGEEFYKFGRCRSERNDFFAMASEKANSASRQIYLTFPADSTFKDEDVSEYFGHFGQVQDVRIPYQQKRMFGFVTFVYPDTVKHILAKGNPHFICDSRVLVKPYKEKGKVSDRRQQQQLDRGEFSPCLSPSGLETREPYDLHLGARMFYNTQEMLFRRKLEEQAELQQAIELQGRRLMNLQLPDLNDRIPHHQRSLSVGAPISLTPQPHTHINENVILLSDSIKQEVAEGHTDNRAASISTAAAAEHQQEGNPGAMHNNGSGNSKEESFNPEEFDLHKSVEQVLPDSLLPSPTKSAVHNLSDSSAMVEVNESSAFSVPLSSSEDKLSLPNTSSSDKALQ